MSCASSVLAVFAAAALPSHAASIYLTPAAPTVDTTVSTVFLDLMMDFSAAELTVGGGIDIDVSGVAAFGSFAPSSYFTTVADPAFSGHGTLRADADYEIHFGSFNGLSGLNNLGRITLAMAQPGVAGTTATVALAVNRFFGPFYSATAAVPIDVTMTGAVVPVGAVPEPQTVALLLAGLGCVGGAAARRRAN